MAYFVQPSLSSSWNENYLGEVMAKKLQDESGTEIKSVNGIMWKCVNIN